MNKIYNQTFFDSHNAIGSSYSYQHSAHPTTVRVTLSLKVNGKNEFYPITVTWNNSTIDFYHAQDGKTYSPTFSKTHKSYEFVRVRKI